jgi:hypothetical protein
MNTCIYPAATVTWLDAWATNRETEREGHEGVEPAVELLLAAQRLELMIIVIGAWSKLLLFSPRNQRDPTTLF